MIECVDIGPSVEFVLDGLIGPSSTRGSDRVRVVGVACLCNPQNMGEESPFKPSRRNFLAAAVTAAGATVRPDLAQSEQAHDHVHQAVPSDISLRVRALESLLVEKGLVDPSSLDALVDAYEHKLGPRNGARVIARAWVDPQFKERLIADATAAIAEQWLFLMEGLPALLLGTIAFFYLSDRPEDARWLPPEERRWLVSALVTERIACQDAHRVTTKAALMHPTVWWLGTLFLLAVIGFYGYSIWSPLVIRSLTGVGDMQIGLITAGMSAVTILAILGNSAHSDKADERPLHVAIPLAIQAAGFLGCALLPTPLLRMLSLALVPIGHGAAYGPFWSVPTRFLSGEAAAGGLAVVATIVNVGGFIGPLLIGLLKEHTGSFAPAFVVLSAAAMISAIMAVRLRRSQALTARSPNS